MSLLNDIIDVLLQSDDISSLCHYESSVGMFKYDSVVKKTTKLVFQCCSW